MLVGCSMRHGRGCFVDFLYNKMMKEEDLKERYAGQLYDKYEILDIIGSGTFGKVYLVRDNVTKELFAMKHVLQNKKYKNRELDILQQINHNSIVRLHHFFFKEETQGSRTLPAGTYLDLVMEYVPDTLARVIKQMHASKLFLERERVIGYSRSLLEALQYLHKNKVCHRDIKPSNILVDGLVAKLCDFGSAKILAAGQKNIAYICSRYYRAPELLFGATFYSQQVDVWSLGCVIAEMLMSRPLFEGSNSTAMLLKIIRTLGSPSHSQLLAMQLDPAEIELAESEGCGVAARLRKANPGCGQDLIELVQRMVVYDPEQRITAEAALKLPLFGH